ncbi:MAG: hypothetical protein H0W85_02775 [Methylotenera sp.]|nr:hypothetical protein [Methylotenera sp.]
MPFKNLFVHYVVNSVLMSMRLLPITPKSNIHFLHSNSYSCKALGASNAFTDVVIKKDSIEIHEYSPDLRQAYVYSSYATTIGFLRALIKQRIEWHLTFQVKSSAVRKLNAQSDYETLAVAAQQLFEDKKRIREANVQRLEKKLNGLFVKIASYMIGF